MKLTKAKLIKIVKPHFEKIGYVEFKDTIEGSQGFFVKKLNDGYYLTFGLLISRYYDSMFTGSYYLSKTTRWATVWGDIPKESDERPGFLLTDEEIKSYSNEAFNGAGVKDIWWDASNENEVYNFLKVIELTEHRFINQPELINKIAQSKDMQLLTMLSAKVKEAVTSKQVSMDYKFLPGKEIDSIPMIWFKAAEKVLTENNGILNANTVKILAADSFRQSELNKVPSVLR